MGSSNSLNGKTGQVDATVLTGGIFTLKSDFWSGSIDYITNLPLIVR
jgi:hypothetical protein